MKIKLFTILFSVASSVFVFGQTNEKIFLEWKISPNDTIKYKTSMKTISLENENNIQSDSNLLLLGEKFKELSNSLSDMNSKLKYQTNLFINKGNSNFIDIEMQMLNDKNNSNQDFAALMDKMKNESNKEVKKKKNKKSKENENGIDSVDFKNMIESLASLNNNIVLRGRISNTGEIISNYYKNAQRNLISVLFELPNRKVEVGEKWKLNVNLVQMDQNFYCDSIISENSVFIDSLIENDNDKIAVIRYNIFEYVLGDYNNPLSGMFVKTTVEKTYMKVSYVATGYFSIINGKWNSYEGEMDIETNNMLGGKSKTEFKLIE
jgi:hypothetical protein